MQGQTLISEGTSGADAISIGARDGGVTLRVLVNGKRSYFNALAVKAIAIYGYRGSDRIEIANALTLPADVEGAKGDDYLSGGNGNDLLIGRRHDHDTLKGGAGRNTLNPRRPTAGDAFADPLSIDSDEGGDVIETFSPPDDSPALPDDPPPATDPTPDPARIDSTPIDPGPGDYPTDPMDGVANA